MGRLAELATAAVFLAYCAAVIMLRGYWRGPKMPGTRYLGWSNDGPAMEPAKIRPLSRVEAYVVFERARYRRALTELRNRRAARAEIEAQLKLVEQAGIVVDASRRARQRRIEALHA